MIQVETSKLYRVGWYDPGGARPGHNSGSRGAAIVVGMDDLERKFVMATWTAVATPTDAAKRVIKMQKRWKCALWGVDVTGPQQANLDLVRNEAREQGIHIVLRGVSLHGEKRRVIETIIQPQVARGQLFRPTENEVSDLKREFVNFPHGVYKDLLDSLAHAIELLPSRSVAEMKELERQQFERYLERTGLSKDEIRRRMASV